MNSHATGPTRSWCRWLACRAASFRVLELDVRIGVKVSQFCPVDVAGVLDGLGFLRQAMMDSKSGRRARQLAAATPVSSIAMLQPGACHEGALPLPTPTVRECVDGVDLRRRGSSVRSATLLEIARCPDQSTEWAFPRAPAVHNATERIVRMPQMRVAAPREALTLRDCEGYLREAEVLKGVPVDSGELLAVFRRVPVEGVARLRFVASERLLLFTMAAGRCGGVWHLHDVAAVRDANGATHLVAHRTRFQTAVLA